MKSLSLPVACLLIIALAAHAGRHALQDSSKSKVAHHASHQVKINDSRMR